MAQEKLAPRWRASSLARTLRSVSQTLGGPETLVSLVEELGPSIRPTTIEEAYKAEIIFIAVPFLAHKELAKQFEQWNGKTVIDATNAFDVAPGELEGLLSSEVVSKSFVGAHLLKAFNRLPAGQLGTNPLIDGQRQVIFISSNDVEASASVAKLATQLGFAAIQVGSLHHCERQDADHVIHEPLDQSKPIFPGDQ